MALEIGTLNFYSWEQVEDDEQKACSGCAGERQGAGSWTSRVCCSNNATRLGAAQH